MKRVSHSVPRKADQSKVKSGLVPNSSSTSANKSSGKSSTDDNQSTFKTGVVVALATHGNEPGSCTADGILHQGMNHLQNISSEQDMEFSQSKSLNQTAVTQSKFLSDGTLITNSDKKKYVSGMLNRLQTSDLIKNNKLLVSEMFKQINEEQNEETPSYQEALGSTSKKPKLSSPCLTYDV